MLVSRHGVRSPTDTQKLTEFTRSQTWPKWPVKDADLTLRGKMLASRMGEYYTRDFAARGLLPTGRPPATNQVYLWADVDQRTRETGAGLLEGIFGCQDSCPSPGSDYGDNDFLFHPIRAGVCEIDPELAAKSILQRAGGSLEKALQPYRDTVQQLQAVLDCCQPKLCHGSNLSCTLDTLPSSIHATSSSASLSGPIAVGSTASEVFLLEYAQDMPPNQVAWGRASTPDRINSLLKLHGLQFDLLQRTTYLARRQGSALVRQVLETLRQTAEGKSEPQRPVPPEAKLVIYVGHDTNLANIGGVLGVDWEFKSGLQDKTPPAGAMAFELLRETASGQRFVRMSYYSQTLDQMREGIQLGPASPPDVAKIVPGCANADGVCPWKDFDIWVTGALDPDCAAAKPR